MKKTLRKYILLSKNEQTNGDSKTYMNYLMCIRIYFGPKQP